MAYKQNLGDMMVKPDGYYANIRNEMLPYIPKNPKRVLEIGCGEGLFGEKLKELYGCEVWGIELFPESAAVAKKNLNKVLVGDVAVAIDKLPNNYFDCVVCNDVLEHLEDPYSVIERLRANLVKGGVIVSSIPNVRYFHNLYSLIMAKEWEYQDAGILDKTHLRFFTINSIRNMFTRHGYDVISLEGINPMTQFPWEYRVANILFRGKLADTKFMQFACVAQKSDAS